MSENELFEESYERLFGAGVGIEDSATPFFESFYRHFLRATGISTFFVETDMPKQVQMLRKSFFHLISFYVSGEPSSQLERIALIHHTLGIENNHYDQWLDALIATVREHDTQSALPTELSWRCAMIPGLTYMRLYGHFRAREQLAS
jgi:truncated hemoglobin YjbI